MTKPNLKRQSKTAPAAEGHPGPLLYSRHIFFFPFQWFGAGRAGAMTLSEPFGRMRNAVAAAGHWEPAPVNRQSDYSAFNYLHDFAAGALFEGAQQTGSAASVLNYECRRELPLRLALRNTVLTKNGLSPETVLAEPSETGDAVFHLKIFLARLNLYETGVGVLSVFADNFSHPSTAAVLLINDFARRLYPPYLHYQYGREAVKNSGALPASIQIGAWSEDWSAFPGDGPRPVPEHFLPAHIQGLLGPGFSASGQGGAVRVQQVLDERMFLMSLLLDAGESERLQALSKTGGQAEDPFWYAYTFADPGAPQIASRPMMRELLQAATYPRWAEDGTLYGVCRYAFVALSGKPGIVKPPMSGNYTRLAELCLVQRASALRFREEASAIAARIAGRDRPSPEVARQIRVLYGDYIRFVNRFHFSEATPVEQGIELYDLLRRQMRVQEQVDSLKDEIEELHAYATMLHEESRSLALNFLTVLGAAFLLPSFLIAYFSLFDEWKAPLRQHPLLVAGVFALGLGAAALIYYGGLFQRRNPWRRLLGLALAALYLYLLFALPHLAEWGWLPE